MLDFGNAFQIAQEIVTFFMLDNALTKKQP